MSSRLDRERQFHDQLFQSDERRPASGFYAVSRGSFSCYESLIFPRARGRRVLELGCGKASYATRLAPLCSSVTGVDISEVAVRDSERQTEGLSAGGRIDFRVMDAENLDLAGERYDLVCGAGILHHLDVDRACASVGAHLRDEGTAVFFEPLGHNPAINAYRRLTPAQRSRDEHPLRMEDLDIMRRHFGSVRFRFFHLAALLAMAARGRRRFESLLAALEGVDEWALRQVAPLRRWAWIVVIDVGARPTAPGAPMGNTG